MGLTLIMYLVGSLDFNPPNQKNVGREGHLAGKPRCSCLLSTMYSKSTVYGGILPWDIGTPEEVKLFAEGSTATKIGSWGQSLTGCVYTVTNVSMRFHRGLTGRVVPDRSGRRASDCLMASYLEALFRGLDSRCGSVRTF